MKIFSTEIVNETVQLTYTDDGQEPTETGQMLVVRMPLIGSSNRSLNWHQNNVIERIYAWADKEAERLQEAMRQGL